MMASSCSYTVFSMYFSDLLFSEKLLQAVEQADFKRPTSIQQAMLGDESGTGDILASAPTGTGKTAAYLLAALSYLDDYPRRKSGPARILILVPTRELAYQVHRDFEQLAAFSRNNAVVLTGGMALSLQLESLQQPHDVLIATPGRLLECLDKEVFEPRCVEWLILDEADRTLQMGQGQDVERIAAETRWRKRTLLFSATLEGKRLLDFSQRLLDDPKRLQIDNVSRREKNKTNQWLHLADSLPHKTALLISLLTASHKQKAVVFVKTRDRVQWLVSILQQQGLAPLWLQGELPQKQRNAFLQQFTSLDSAILVATDVAARGLHIDDITHVINFDLPRTADIYLHRIGRTGRAGKKGTAISLVEAHDVAMVGKIERYLDQPLERRTIEGLKPKNKEARVARKKKPTASAGKRKPNAKGEKLKQRHRDTKNKGAPRWLRNKQGDE